MRTTKIKCVETVYPADCVEVLPFCATYFVCGTYQLVENIENQKNESRVGTLSLYQYTHNNDSSDLECCSIEHQVAIFDLKWCRHPLNEKAMLALANTDGSVSLKQFDAHKDLKDFSNMSTIQLDDNNLTCSLDWSTNKFPHCLPQIVASDSGGQLSLLKLQQSQLTIDQQWQAHHAECWICAFDATNSNVIYSGGDDCKMKSWDIRMGTSMPLFTKRYDMGVTSIHDNINYDNYFACGSYDEHLYIWDKRNVKNSISSCKLGGGVWKIKWICDKSDLLMAACMHDGFKVVSCFNNTNDGNRIDIICEYKEHESLAYGIDYFPSSTKQANVVSCSFYDKRLDIWQFHHSE